MRKYIEMKLRVWVLTFVTLLIVGRLSAQEATIEGGYRLRTPSAQEYVQSIAEISGDLQSQNEFRALSSTIFHLFPNFEDLSFDSLNSIYNNVYFGDIDLFWARGQWVRRMVATWILENDVDLSQSIQLEFEDFHVTIIPRDFNADGINEYLLDITKGEPVNRAEETCLRAEVIDYLIVRQTEIGYEFIDAGIPWKGQQSWGYSSLNGGVAELRFDDLNADGLPEWVLVVGGELLGGPGMGYSDGGALLVLGWSGDQLEYLAPTIYAGDPYDLEISTSFVAERQLCGSPIPNGVHWEFTNIDDDAPLEILQAQEYADNWNCMRTETKVFDWNATTDRYEYSETNTVYADDTQGCAQRNAEEIVWTGDYAAAIPIFEQALTLSTPDFSQGEYFNYARSMNQYLKARLAFAYLMTGQEQLATPLLETLSSEKAEEEPIGLFVQTLITARDTNTSPLETCIAVYNLFTSNFPQIRVGYTGDDLYYSDNPYLPENVGCNAPTMLKTVLLDNSVSLSTTP